MDTPVHSRRYVPALTRLFMLMLTVGLLAGCAGADEAADDVGDAAQEAADSLPGVGEPSFHTMLTGEAEVPGPGDPDGSGEAHVTLDSEDGEVCYEISVEDVESITAAHIHTGGPGEAGGPVVNFNVADNGLDGCVTGVSADVIGDITDNPSGFYVNVHNESYPAGALRGQLVD